MRPGYAEDTPPYCTPYRSPVLQDELSIRQARDGGASECETDSSNEREQRLFTMGPTYIFPFVLNLRTFGGDT